MSLLLPTQLIGFIISVVGACGASPQLIRYWMESGRRAAHVIAVAARRVLLWANWWRRKEVTLHGVVRASGHATFSVVGAGGGDAPPAAHLLVDRVRRLEDRMRHVDGELVRLRHQANDDRAANERAHADLGDAQAAGISTLRTQLAKNDQRAVQTDARALPVAVLGLLLVTFAAEVADLWPPVWFAAMTAAAVFTFYMTRGAWRANPAQAA